MPARPTSRTSPSLAACETVGWLLRGLPSRRGSHYGMTLSTQWREATTTLLRSSSPALQTNQLRRRSAVRRTSDPLPSDSERTIAGRTLAAAVGAATAANTVSPPSHTSLEAVEAARDHTATREEASEGEGAAAAADLADSPTGGVGTSHRALLAASPNLAIC